MKKIVFLDIDGVLNSDQTYEYYGLFGGFFTETDPLSEKIIAWGQDLVDNLKYIIKETEAEIVISSTWRAYFTIDKFKQMFKIYGWEDVPIIGMTDRHGHNNHRGLEVNAWLTENGPVDSFVILDDNDWFLVEQKTRFVQTSIFTGLDFDSALKAVEILNKTIIHD